MNDRFDLADSFIDRLAQRAAQHPDRCALTFVQGDDGAHTTLSYAQLDRQARELGALMQRAAPPGERAVILLPSGVEYVVAFFACLYAGVIAVPAFPPESMRPQHLGRLIGVLRDARPRFVLTLAALRDELGQALLELAMPECEILAVDALPATDAASWRDPMLSRDTTAFLQYTSGSTAQPKGVQVTHGNLMANELAIQRGFGITPDDVIVSWLPLYHDMGLIGGLLQPIFSGVPVVLMAPRNFLERPVRWLEAMARYRGSVSGGPDFAFRLCAERIPDSALAELDLSSWRVAFCGSEPIRPDTLERFAQKFAPAGLQPGALYPCYGLAEATLFVTGGLRGEGARKQAFDPAALARHEAAPSDDGVSLVDCGATPPDHDVRIMTESHTLAGPNAVGEIWAAGPSIANGYWNNPAASAATFVSDAGRVWLRTGDLGFLHGGRLFITGRAKDMIILRGQNLYPQDIEAAVEEQVELVRKGRVAAFPVLTETREAIGVAAEVGRGVQKMVPPERLAQAVSEAVAQVCQEAPSVVLLLQPGALPKTSSGKLQRGACLSAWRNGKLDVYAAFEDGRLAQGAPESPPTDGAPQGEVEDKLAALWAEILGVSKVPRDVGFFALGGNSVSAVQFVALARERHNMALELRDLYGANTVAEVAARVRTAQQAVQEAGSEVQPEGQLPATPRLGPQPLSAAQARMWFLWQLDPSGAAYNIAGTLRVRGAFSEAAAQDALRALALRHDSLRTRFSVLQDGPIQHILAESEWSLQRAHLPVNERGEAEHLEAWTLAQARQPFDLLNEPPVRAVWLRVSAQDHLLLLVLHHIVADGGSMNVLTREFAQLYRAASAQTATADIGPAPQYLDCADAQKQRLEDGGAERLLSVWRARLGNAHPVLALPAQRPRPAQRTGEGASVGFTVDAALNKALRALARRRNVTVFELLAAGFLALLHRCCAASDLRLGMTVANRDVGPAQNAVGLFVNTVALRVDVPAGVTIPAFIDQTASALRDAQAHGELPFDALVEALQPPRVPGCHPLFQVMLNHQRRDASSLDAIDGAQFEVGTLDPAPARFDLGLATVEDADGHLSGTLSYARDMFDAAAVERLADGYLHLLGQFTATPEQRLDSVEWLPPAASAQLQGWARAEFSGPRLHADDEYVPVRIARVAQATPQAVALVGEGFELRYAELDRRANRLAHALQQRGVGPERLVAIGMERGPELVVAVLAVLRAGGAYVPVDPEYPAERIAYLLEDSGARWLITQEHLRERYPVGAEVDVLTPADAQEARVDDPALSSPPRVALRPENLAYVIYTSGSTGQPKGAANTHGALRARLDWMQAAYPLDGASTLLQKTPFSFDVAVWEILWPLATGARLAIAAPGEHKDPQRLARLIRDYDVTAVHFVPSMLALFVEQDEADRCASLRYVYSGGEALTPALRARVMQRLPWARLDNRYGPSEAAINATWWQCSEADTVSVPIGRPLPSGSVQVLDGQMCRVPPSVAGDLYLGGIGVARGYHGRPGLTAKRFLPDPYSAEPGARLYASGDLASWREDGALEYLGRADQQVKLRGFRVELGEIEAHILAHPDVRAAAVVMMDDAGSGQSLAAYVTGPDAGQVSGIAAWLGLRLPAHMVPGRWQVLDALPLLASGKLDRNSLPALAPLARREPPAAAERQTWTPLAQRVAQVWEDVLKIAPDGLDANFFELGGHSLLATQAVTRLRRELNIELPLRTLFEAQDLGAFAAVVQQALDAGIASGQPPLVKVDRSQALPLSYSQERMWFLWQTEPDGAAYNVGGAVMLGGALDVAALERALQSLVLRHEALRTRFPLENGKPVQRIAPASAVAMQHVDLSALPPAARDARYAELAHEEAHRPFNLEVGPLLRVVLVRLGHDDHALLVTIHHIVSEGWAMDVFADEYVALYEAYAQGREPALPELPVQYADYAAWQRTWLEAGEGARQLSYWKAALGDEHPVLNLPTDRPRPAVQSYRGDYFRFELDSRLAAGVRGLASAHRATLFMTLSAALMALLHRYTGQEDMRLGYPVANRVRPEFEGLIGAFLNTQALRCDVRGEQRASELLAAVREAALAAQSHQDVPFHQVVEAVKPARSAAHTPIFQVLCNVQRWRFQQTRTAAGLALTFVPNDSRATKFDLMLDVSDIDDVLGASLTYSTDLFDRATVERMADHWQRLLADMVAHPDKRLDALTFQSGAERAQAVAQGRGPAVPLPERRCAVHQQFEDMVLRQPDAVALCVADGDLSYAELNRRANRLAHHLLRAGVGPGARVGVCLYRSTELVVALLGILKAGAAYVPLDPEYPADRLDYMVDDCQPACVLASLATADTLAGVSGVVVLDALSLDGLPDYNPGLRSHGKSLAYLIYTSGSTGRPKGVGNEHAALYNRIAWMQRQYGLTGADTVLQKTPFSFDVSVWEFFWPLTVGARLAMAAPGAHREPVLLADAIRRWQVTTMHFVPSMLQAFVADEATGACPSLRHLMCSGEALPAEARDRAMHRFPGVGLHNLYGPTEATIDVTHWTCGADDGATVPIGKPIDNVTACLLDGGLNPCATGVAGELYLGGIALAQGYHRRAALTAERYVPDPDGAPGSRLYRTGDLARRRADGAIEYLGRLDHQVKIRGLRIELGEIEARLLEQSGVREAVVVAQAGRGAAGARLVAYVSAQHGCKVDTAALRGAIAASLPEYMVPTAWVVLDQLPLSPNGKVDRKALPAPDTTEASGAFEAPQGKAESTLARILQDVLGVERVGRHDNFFELGGDSIVSLQVVGRARQAGLALAARDVFQHQTLAELAAAALAASVATEGRVEYAAGDGAVTLLPIQREFFAQEMPVRGHWNQSVLLRVRDSLQVDALTHALQAVLLQHDALRLRFAESGGLWSAQHGPALDAQQVLWRQDLATEADLSAAGLAVQRSLDLNDGPMLRMLWARLANGDEYLLIAAHHLVVDGVSWRILLEDLERGYRQALSGQTVDLGPRTLSYQAWGEALWAHAQTPAVLAQLPYWQAQQAGEWALPCDNPQGSNTVADERRQTVTLDRTLTQRLLKDAVGAYRTQINDLLLTALVRAMTRWAGQASWVVNLEGHGREPINGQTNQDLSRTVGWFTTLYPVSLNADGNLPDAIKRVKEQLRAVPEGGRGFGLLRHGPHGDTLSGQPELLFNYLGQFDASFGNDALFEPAQNEQGGETRDGGAPLGASLTLNSRIYGGELGISFSYSGKRFNEESIAKLAQAYESELKAVIAHCTDPAHAGLTPSDVPLAGLDQAQIDSLSGPARGIEDVYGLSPMQQGMLFHAQSEPDSGLYVNQLAVTVRGLDPARFIAAWQQATQRHAILRTGFEWPTGAAAPVQIVRRRVTLPVRTEDWRGKTPTDQDAALAALAQAERAQGFDLAVAPLQRLLLVQLDDDSHRLIWTHHHILMDGWSATRLLEQVVAQYGGAGQAGEASRYGDYIGWLGSQDRRAAAVFWRDQTEPLDGPTRIADALAPDGGPKGNGLHTLTFNAAQTAAMNAFAQRERITLNTLVQGAWLLLLQRHTGKHAVTTGVTVAGRPPELAGVDQMIGLFINTLPLVHRVPPEAPLGDWLRQIQQVNLQLRDYDHAPLAEIQRWAGRPGQALFDSIVVFENYPVDAALRERAAGGLVFSEVAANEQTHYAVALSIHAGAAMRIDLRYAPDVLSPSQARHLADRLVHLLHTMPADADRPLGRLTLMAPAQRQAHLAAAQGATATPRPGLVHEWIAEQARRTPDATALVQGATSLTYAQLEARASRLAARLAQAGVGPDKRVAIYAHRAIEMALAVLAVMKAGAAYVPIDPEYPTERIAHMLSDCGASIVLTQSTLLPSVPDGGLQAWLLDSPSTWDAPAQAPQTLRLSPDNLAYCIYTSGSTGRPKGVGNTHAALANRLDWMQSAYPLGSADRVLQKTPFSFDVSVWEFFWPWSVGATLVMAEPGAHRDPRALRELIDGHGITTLHFVPSMLQAFIAAGELAGRDSLRTVLCSGEALPAALQAQFHAQHPAALHNLYGPTEAAIDVTAWTCRPDADAASVLSVPIGMPISNIKAVVLDAQLDVAPDGVASELYLGGIGLARGYIGQPALTAERFVADPDGAPGSRLYRTGDLTRRREDGAIEYLGRLDHQVKIRGLRIELGEIEARLLAQDQVREAVVTAVAHAHGGASLAAYVTGPQASQAERERLRAGLRAVLPEYMVPARILILAALPLSPNGKVDRKALPAPDAADASGAFEAPQGEAEATLARILQDVLGVERVGRHDNFFELGGDSIVSLQVVGRARQAGLALAARDVFQHQTLAELAAASVASVEREDRVEYAAGDGAVALLPIQREFFAQEMPVRGHWNQSVLLRVRESLNADALTHALQAVLLQHDALRLRFTESEGVWSAQHGPALDAQQVLWRQDLATEADLSTAGQAVQRSLDLSDGPLLRMLWARVADGAEYLLIAAHHLVVDGVSWRILLEDLKRGYRQALSGQTVELGPRTLSYQAWGEALWAHAQSPAVQAQLPYWQAQLAGEQALPCDNPQGSNTVADERRQTVTVDRTLTQRLLKDAVGAYRTQINDLLLTALVRAMTQWAGQSSWVVNLEGHGRDPIEAQANQDLSRTVGWFTTLYPVRLNADGELPDAIKRVKEQLRAVPEGGRGFGLLRHGQHGDTLSGQPELLFNYLGQFDASFGDDALFEPAQSEQGGETRDGGAPLGASLTLNGRIYGGELGISFSYSGKRFNEQTIAKLAQAYESELKAVIAHCTDPAHAGLTPSDVPLAALDQAQLDGLTVPARDIEDVYGLSPMQQGMLFHAQSEPGSGLYVNQLAVTVRGLDPARFIAAWQQATQRQAILRTGFEWPAGAAAPVQIVRRRVMLPVRTEDWREQTPADQDAALAALAQAERAQGFDLSVAPLQRLLLVQLDDDSHRLVWTHHHILMDGWSASGLMADVLRSYRGETLASVVGGYRDYIGWLGLQDPEAGAAFWRERLARIDEPTLLANALPAPTEATSSQDQGQSHAHLQSALTPQQTDQLKRYAQRERITLNTLVQGAWVLLLQRYTGQATVSFGATVAGRPEGLAGADAMLGLFINTVPVIQSPAPGERTGDWLRALQQENAQLREHSHTPLYDIQRWAGRSGQPLFDTVLVFENYPVDEALRQRDGLGLAFGASDVSETPHYPLTLTISESQGLQFAWRTLRQVLDDADVARLARAYAEVLTGLADERSNRLGRVSLLDPAQRAAALRPGQSGATAYPDALTVHGLFEATVARTPDAIAVSDSAGSWTYAELNGRANALASALRQAGVGPDVLVGLAAGRSASMLAGMLGVLKAGGAYVPLDPDYPAQRLNHMVRDSGIRLVLATADTREAMMAVAPEAEHWLIDPMAAVSTATPATRIAPGTTHPEHLAYCIYTSGSTGVPKGVALRHRAVVNFLLSMAEAPGLHAQDRVLALTSLSFDIAVLELLLPLVTGARVVLASRDDARDPAALLARIHDEQVSVVQATPSTWRMLLDTPASGSPTLRAVLTGGEALPAEVAQRLARWAPQVWNLYGPTETTIWSARRLLTADAPQPLLGGPIANTDLRVLDACLDPVPAGVAGELYIGGAGLARGYHGRPGLSAERFVPNPYGPPGARMYRTGDLARMRAGGLLEYIGRIDQQVKIRGHRIETGEIEAALSAIPGIAQAAVTARRLAGAPALVAYLVADPGASRPSDDTVLIHLQQRLPDYMVPARLQWLTAMPLTPNGKLDRKALPDPAHGIQDYAPPATDTERQVAAIWEQVLELPRVGRDDDFFRLGGHSLAVARVVSRLRETLGVELPVRTVFASRTVAQLAASIDAGGGLSDLEHDLALLTGALDQLESSNE